MEDWALIRRLAAEGVPKAQIAARLGISRTTVVKAVASDLSWFKLVHTPAGEGVEDFLGLGRDGRRDGDDLGAGADD